MRLGLADHSASELSAGCPQAFAVMTVARRDQTLVFLDVAYAADAAGVGCVLADSWTTGAPTAQTARRFACAPAPYVPGEFYKRELPLLEAVIDALPSPPAVLIIDGYVWLDEDCTPGLGARLFIARGSTTPVVGVAKTRYAGDTWSQQVQRGQSLRPLHVTAAGMASARAAELIRGMHGPHRIPTLLQQADRLSRAALARGAGA